MKHYIADTQSGHIVILHGDAALQEYRCEVERDEAEPLIRVTHTRLDRAEHRRLRDAGQCYGPCPIKGRD